MVKSIENTLNRIQEIREKINSLYSFAGNPDVSFKDVLNATIQNTESRTQNTEHRAQGSEQRAQNTDSKTQNTEHRALKTDSELKSDVRNQRLPADYLNQLIEKYAKENDLSPDLIRAVIKVESNFNPRAISPAGAKGLMQLMPKTAEALGVKDIFDPEENIAGGTKYLRQMLDRFNDNLPLALAAYNAGPTQVERSGGIPNIRETQNYVRKVLSLYERT